MLQHLPHCSTLLNWCFAALAPCCTAWCISHCTCILSATKAFAVDLFSDAHTFSFSALACLVMPAVGCMGCKLSLPDCFALLFSHDLHSSCLVVCCCRAAVTGCTAGPATSCFAPALAGLLAHRGHPHSAPIRQPPCPAWCQVVPQPPCPNCSSWSSHVIEVSREADGKQDKRNYNATKRHPSHHKHSAASEMSCINALHLGMMLRAAPLMQDCCVPQLVIVTACSCSVVAYQLLYLSAGAGRSCTCMWCWKEVTSQSTTC